ncbi:MAG: bifunctional YncE family protein/alkaline phosphatase family protein [Bryobacteraceae bacterium]
MRKILLVCVFAAAAVVAARETAVFSVLSSTVRIGRQPQGFYLLPTSQLLRPWGEQALLPGRPVDMTFDSRKRVLAVLNWRGVEVLDGSTGVRVGDVRARSTSYTGVAFRPGDRELWASETTRNGPDAIIVAPVSELGVPAKAQRIDLQGHPLPAGIAFSPDGSKAYVAFSRNNSVAVIDAATRAVLREVPVGMAPFAVVYSKEHGKVFVSNRGGRRPVAGDTTAPSSGSQIVTHPLTGSATSGTLSIIDAETFAVKEVAVGLAPSALALSPDEKTLAVANSHADTVSLLDTVTLARTDVKMPSYPEGVLGSMPAAAAFARDGNTLYVACGGINAVTVLRRAGKSWKVTGALPTGWFPTSIALDGEGGLRVLNIKGVGSTDNRKGAYNSKQYEGSLLRIPAPDAGHVAAGTREVRAANNPVLASSGGIANLTSLGIRHVFLIVKENRTYDQVFGDIPKGNGDPKLVMYGREITPNHHALAEKYVLLDNFHTGGAISFDGHQWLMQAFVSDYVERAFASSPRGYAWNLADSLMTAPTGFFWQGGARPLNVRVYGEFQLPARFDPVTQQAHDINEGSLLPWSEYWRLYKEGKWRSAVGSRSGVPAMQPICSQSYPNNSTSIPDQIRAEEYLREFAEREKSGELPELTVLTLNNDHTNGTRPGSPTPRAMVADNDLALGRIVEAVSKSRFWPNTLMLVVEDDAQDGLDHVDGHRTVALAIGPHVRRGAVDSNFYTHISMVRTIQDLYRIPPRTRFLKAARAMHSVFTAQADTSPYRCLPVSVPLDEMNPPLAGLSGRRLWAARKSLEMNWHDPDDIDQDALNRILWWDAKGWNRAYPR